MELARGAEVTSVELVAPVEKAAADSVEKIGHSGREARWRGRKTGCHALAWWRCRLAERRCGGEHGRRGGASM
jgi:hypothetical protein